MDIKKRLLNFRTNVRGPVNVDGEALDALASDALREIERLTGLVRGLQVELDIERAPTPALGHLAKRVAALETLAHPPLGQEQIYERLEALERWRKS